MSTLQGFCNRSAVIEKYDSQVAGPDPRRNTELNM